MTREKREKRQRKKRKSEKKKRKKREREKERKYTQPFPSKGTLTKETRNTLSRRADAGGFSIEIEEQMKLFEEAEKINKK